MTDRKLFAEYCKSGSGEVFGEILSRHMDMVHSTCKRILREDHAAEDAAQATFLLLVRKAKKLSRKTVLSGWLFRTAQFTALRLSRSRKRRARHEREAAMEKEQATRAAPAATWESVSPELDAALATLTSHQQNVVVMRLMQQKPQADVARELGCAESSVSAVLSRSLDKLRGKLSKMGISLSAAALGAMLVENAVISAPAGLVASVQAACLGQTAASTSAVALTEGVANAMGLAKLKMAAVMLAGAAAIGTGGAITASQLMSPEMAKPAKSDAANVVLTARSRWRTYAMRGPRVLAARDGDKVQRWSSAVPPPAGWMKPRFDDSTWVRAAGPFPGGPRGWASVYQPYNRAVFCMRGAFNVKDPAGIKKLTLTMKFLGGAAIYLNGREVYRSHLPKGELKPDTPAATFPRDAYVDAKGKIIPEPYHANAKVRKGDKDLAARIAKRTARGLGPIALPTGSLKKGVNVLAVELHRAAFLPESLKWRGKYSKSRWAHIGISELRMATDAPAGVITTGAAVPAGIQVWNEDPHRQLRGSEYADAAEKLRPVRLVGARRGVYSGVVAARLPKSAKTFSATVTELKGPGTISAGSVKVRHARFTKLGYGRIAVLARLEAEAPANAAKTDAVLRPVWVTVEVPKDAKPGEYAGNLSISAAGLQAISVPLELEVVDWTLPDAKSFGTRMGIYQSYDSLALHYDVPLWSEKHWKLVEKSWELLGLMGNNQVIVPLVCRTEFGNDESMITWVKGKDGSYTHDFTVFDRYMDIAAKHCGIRTVAFQVYFGGGWFSAKPEKRPVAVTVVDPETGKREMVKLPAYGTAEARKLWKPLMSALLARLEKRGLKKAAVLGIGHCGGMHEQVRAHFNEVARGVGWQLARHARTIKPKTEAYVAYLYVSKSVPSPSKKRNYGWKHGDRFFMMCQRIYDNFQPEICMRTAPERALLLGDAGVGRICHDYWPVKGSTVHGGRKSIFDRFPSARAGQRCPHLNYLAVPGNDGPTLTSRILMLREGLQEAEGRIYLEKALLEKKISGDLATRVQKLLDERVALCQMTHNGEAGLHSAASGENWSVRSARLYRILGEVAKKLGE